LFEAKAVGLTLGMAQADTFGAIAMAQAARPISKSRFIDKFSSTPVRVPGPSAAGCKGSFEPVGADRADRNALLTMRPTPGRRAPRLKLGEYSALQHQIP
jgi:hypothetical protein